MKKRGKLLIFLLFSFLLAGFLGIGIIYAQEDEGTSEERIGIEEFEEDFGQDFFEDDFDKGLGEEEIQDKEDLEDLLDDPEFADAELDVGAGIKPDSALYAIDKFFDRFADEGGVRQERIAEFRAMIAEGKKEEAKEAIRDYAKHASEFEKEVDPEKRDEARRSASAIRNVLEDLEEDTPEEISEEFFDDVIEREKSIATAAEIASKINSLCQELAQLDPGLFYDNCKVGDEGANWHKEMYKDLTEGQKEEAKKFAKIMKQCFRTSGQDCACEQIPFTDFAKTCSVAASLATACEIEKDETACEKLDDLDMPRLPPHLQEIMDDLEKGMMHEKFDMHMPPECIEAGVTSPKECGKIMINAHAPPECKEALLAADVQGEREAREICDKIMMDLHMPKECKEKGITDPSECARYMDSFRGEYGPGPITKGPRIDFDCRAIEDPMKRLECYDKASSQAKGYKGFEEEDYQGPCLTDEDWKVKKQECRDLYGEHAGDEPIMGDSGQGYECPVDIKCIDFGQFKDEEYYEGETGYPGEGYEESECKDGCSDECPGASRTDCVDGGMRCKCYYEEEDQPPTEEQPPTEDDTGAGEEEVSTSPLEETETTETGTEGGETSDETSNTGETNGEEGDMTGGFITGNAFLDYWFS